jgi:hypothetical protein
MDVVEWTCGCTLCTHNHYTWIANTALLFANQWDSRDGHHADFPNNIFLHLHRFQMAPQDPSPAVYRIGRNVLIFPWLNAFARVPTLCEDRDLVEDVAAILALLCGDEPEVWGDLRQGRGGDTTGGLKIVHPFAQPLGLLPLLEAIARWGSVEQQAGALLT